VAYLVLNLYKIYGYVRVFIIGTARVSSKGSANFPTTQLENILTNLHLEQLIPFLLIVLEYWA
jgi:hypothetical protein